LASGKLTAEEEAVIRARLAEIATERGGLLKAKEAALLELMANGGLSEEEMAALQAQLGELASRQSQNELDGLVRKLAALNDEEVDLLRRLAEGNLTAEEEAEIRARLATIAAEREGLQSQLTQAELAEIDGKLAVLDSKLSALDDEEAGLLRRLAAGDLSPEEEADIRARLAAIATERAGLLAQREGLLQTRADVVNDASNPLLLVISGPFLTT
jgi:DNA repair exonuclease SbcCD ATPase subunit